MCGFSLRVDVDSLSNSHVGIHWVARVTEPYVLIELYCGCGGEVGTALLPKQDGETFTCPKCRGAVRLTFTLLRSNPQAPAAE